MSKIIFTMTQINQLKKPERRFRIRTLNPVHGRIQGQDRTWEYERKGPQQILTETGFDLIVIGKWKAQFALIHWRQTFRKDGEEGLRNDKRGKSLGDGRPKTDESMKRRLAKAEARFKYMTAENELLKKLEKIEGQAKHTN